MKFLFIPVLVLFVACSDSKEKSATTKNADVQSANNSSGNATVENSKQDEDIINWLAGKEWKAENEAAPFSIFKTISRDSAVFSIGTDRWTIKNNRLEMFGTDWPFTKVNDTTFTIYVEPTQKTYAYKFVARL